VDIHPGTLPLMSVLNEFGRDFISYYEIMETDQRGKIIVLGKIE